MTAPSINPSPKEHPMTSTDQSDLKPGEQHPDPRRRFTPTAEEIAAETGEPTPHA